MVRNYRREYDTYHKRLKQKKNRAKRNAARKKLGLKKGDKRVADHKVLLSKGGSNSKKNLRKVSQKTNLRRRRK